MGKDLLALHNKSNVTEVRNVEQEAQTLDQSVHCNVTRRAHLKTANNENMQVIEPPIPVEATKDVDALGADQ